MPGGWESRQSVRKLLLQVILRALCPVIWKMLIIALKSGWGCPPWPSQGLQTLFLSFYFSRAAFRVFVLTSCWTINNFWAENRTFATSCFLIFSEVPTQYLEFSEYLINTKGIVFSTPWNEYPLIYTSLSKNNFFNLWRLLCGFIIPEVGK